MNKDVFRKLRQMLMEELDLSRELSDKEILDVIDELILNQIKDVRLALKEKVQLRQELFYSVRKLDVLQELVDGTRAGYHFCRTGRQAYEMA